MKQKWQYYGLFIDKETHDKLIDVLVDHHWIGTLNEAERGYLDHCTLLHKSQISNDNTISPNKAIKARLDYLLENGIVNANLIVTSVGISEKAMAFKVIILDNSEGIYRFEICANDIPHITICTFNGGKPVDSNNITNWYNLNEPIVIEATLKRV